MAHERRRVEKVAKLLQAELSSLILTRLKDPKVDGVTITDVRVSSDLSVARVFFAAADDVAAGEAAEGLGRATSFLRREVGRRLELRKTPELRFHRDEALEHGHRVDAVLREIQEGEE